MDQQYEVWDNTQPTTKNKEIMTESRGGLCDVAEGLIVSHIIRRQQLYYSNCTRNHRVDNVASSGIEANAGVVSPAESPVAVR